MLKSPRTIRSKVVIEYLDDMPELKNTDLARLIYQDEPDLFSSVEDVRGIVRRYRGKSGKHNVPKLTKEYIKAKDNRVVLAFSCPHIPYEHKFALDFLKQECDIHQPTDVICLGDLCDINSVTFHEISPNMPAPQRELDITREALKTWYAEFPQLKICIGNHDRRYMRKAEASGIPSSIIKSLQEIWDVPTWDFVEELYIDDVRYIHGDGASKAYINAFSSGVSHLQGHLHSELQVQYRTTKFSRVFGATCGSLCDWNALAMAYAKAMRYKPVLGCAVINNGASCRLIPMEI